MVVLGSNRGDTDKDMTGALGTRPVISLHVRLRAGRPLCAGSIIQVLVLHALLDRHMELRLDVRDFSSTSEMYPAKRRIGTHQDRNRGRRDSTYHHFLTDFPLAS